MNRTIAPPYKDIEHIHFVEPQLHRLSNGLQLAIFKTGSQEVIKIEFNFEAGTLYQNKNLLATTTNALLREGSKNYSADEIAEQLDFYGSHLSLSVDKDVAKVTLFSLVKNLDAGLKILADIIIHPTFPQEKLQRYLSKQLQNFRLDLQKVKHLANRKFSSVLFGENHPYGKRSQEKDFDLIERKDLVEFYQQTYQTQTCKVIVAGQFDDDIIKKIESFFGTWKTSGVEHQAKIFKAPKLEQFDYLVEKAEAMQSGLRLGKILFNRSHPDYPKMQVLNTLLGGYFGSRLMKNIREDKGYTYGIGSALISLKQTGYLTIVSEVNATVSADTIKEINKELHILRTELVSDDELAKVKNYMLGQLLRAVDGPFSQSETYLNAWLFDMDWSYYENYMKSIRSTTAQDLLELSQKYLQEDSFIRVIAGK